MVRNGRTIGEIVKCSSIAKFCLETRTKIVTRICGGSTTQKDEFLYILYSRLLKQASLRVGFCTLGEEELLTWLQTKS